MPYIGQSGGGNPDNITLDLKNGLIEIKDHAVTDKQLAVGVASPIGSIIAWLKSYTHTPTLPTGWVECNGQTLSDSESPYNGQTIPSLNSTNIFLRGNTTSGGTGGSVSHSHNSLGSPILVVDFVGGVGGYTDNTGNVSNGTTSAIHLPLYYDIVWIMRIK